GRSPGSPVQIFNPSFLNNKILDPSLIDPAARGLLQLIPLPNASVAGSPQNRHDTFTNSTSSNNINIRMNHTFSQAQQQQQQFRGNRGGGGGGGRGGRGGRGTNVNFGVQISTNSNTTNNAIPTVK